MECTCKTPGKPTDFIVAVSPRGEIAWYARKDCPLHGMKDLTEVEPKEETPHGE